MRNIAGPEKHSLSALWGGKAATFLQPGGRAIPLTTDTILCYYPGGRGKSSAGFVTEYR